MLAAWQATGPPFVLSPSISPAEIHRIHDTEVPGSCCPSGLVGEVCVDVVMNGGNIAKLAAVCSTAKAPKGGELIRRLTDAVTARGTGANHLEGNENGM